jgi:hypothetical protein
MQALKSGSCLPFDLHPRLTSSTFPSNYEAPSQFMTFDIRPATMEPGKSLRRPSEIITSLRKKAEEERASTKVKPGLIKVAKNARYCPAGHLFARALVQQRQCLLQAKQGLPPDVLPPVVCAGCAFEISGEYIAGCCKTCDIDFCEDCYESGRSIEEILEEARGSTVDLSESVGEITMSPTNEYCAAGHQLGRVSGIVRRRHLQEQHGLDAPPTIECDCCSKAITNEYIAGCCLECDIDFCENCFKSGQSYQDVLEDRTGPPEEEDTPDLEGQRYNSRRPTYKGTGRVNYDCYPDPTAYQWTFTGSNEKKCIEYFEKDYGRIGIIKLDFYYAIGTARTILEHPSKGEKRLFGKRKTLRPALYRKILQEPKTHTDRYYRKKSRQVV